MSIILEAISRHKPDKIALIGDDQTLTYKELAAAVDDIALGLDSVKVLFAYRCRPFSRRSSAITLLRLPGSAIS